MKLIVYDIIVVVVVVYVIIVVVGKPRIYSTRRPNLNLNKKVRIYAEKEPLKSIIRLDSGYV